jgi:hypothetical protein
MKSNNIIALNKQEEIDLLQSETFARSAHIAS